MKNKKCFSESFPTFNILWGTDLKAKQGSSAQEPITPTANNVLVDRPIDTVPLGFAKSGQKLPLRSHPDASHWGPGPASGPADPPLPQVQPQKEQDGALPHSHQLSFPLALPSSWLLFRRNAGTISRCHCQTKTTLYLNIPV